MIIDVSRCRLIILRILVLINSVLKCDIIDRRTIKNFYSSINLFYAAVANIFYRIFKQLYADGGAGFRFALPAFVIFLDSRPVGMIGPVVEGFGMGHQTENPAAGITYPGDIINRSVGVERKFAVCGSAVEHCIPEHYLVIINQTTDRGWVGIKFSFPMPYGKFQPI